MLLPDSSISPETAADLAEVGWTVYYISYDFCVETWHVQLMSKYGQLTYRSSAKDIDIAVTKCIAQARSIKPPVYRTPGEVKQTKNLDDFL